MGTKKCSACGLILAIDDFTRCSREKDGRSCRCRKCNYISQKRYEQSPKGKEARKRSNSTKSHSIIHRASKERYNILYPERKRAWTEIERSLHSGKIERGSCVVCGATGNIHGHHHDYGKPLDVLWLCPPHHRGLHKLERLSMTGRKS